MFVDKLEDRASCDCLSSGGRGKGIRGRFRCDDPVARDTDKPRGAGVSNNGTGARILFLVKRLPSESFLFTGRTCFLAIIGCEDSTFKSPDSEEGTDFEVDLERRDSEPLQIIFVPYWSYFATSFVPRVCY